MGIGSTLFTTENNTDDMPSTEYEKFEQPFWENKASKFKVLFETIKENQQKLQNMEQTIKENGNNVSQIEKELKQKNQMIDILTEQNIKEREKTVNLANIQKESRKKKEERRKKKEERRK